MPEEMKSFPTGDGSWSIIVHRDGTVQLEAEAEYGDSEIGWGSTTAYLELSKEQAKALAEFLLEAVK